MRDQLVLAEGRELVGMNAASSWNDSDKAGLTAPTNGSAMQPFIEYYEYDAAGNMLQMKHTAGVGTFTNYWTRNFTIDTGSNHTTVSDIGSDGGSSESYTYDNRGNITAGMNHLYTPSPADDNMFYNEENRLEQVLITADITAYYQYDASGQRVRKVKENTASGGHTHIRKYIGQWELYDKLDSGGGVLLERESLNIMDDQARVALIDTPITSPPGTDQVIRYQFSNHLQGNVSKECFWFKGLESIE